MKTSNILKSLFNFTLALVLIVACGVSSPILAIGASAAIAVVLNFVPAHMSFGSGFITNGSEWTGKEMEDIILRPIFLGQSPKEMGIRVMFSVKSTVKLTFFGPVSKILKAYADGWTGGSASTKKQKELELKEFKAENSYSKQTYKDTVMENITQKGGDNAIDGTTVQKAEIELFMNGISEDVRRIFWLGKKLKYTLHASGYYTATADTDYNVIDGIWTALIADAATSPSADQIKRVAISNGTVAQVDTHTLTGTSGTANININGVNYLATFTTDLTTSAANFVTSHAAALLLRGIVVTSSTVTVILTAAIAGQPFLSVAPANVTGNLAGTLALTTANTAAAALTTDEALTTMKAMVVGSNKTLKSLLKSARFYMTDTMIENYQATLESMVLESSRTALVDGIERFTYRGIPIIPMNIDAHLTADFNEPYPHRAILTIPDNLCLVLNGQADESEIKFWFENKDNLNMQRAQFMFGADYILPELITVAY